ncbi:MAG: SDR family NAD(P)-dependent oxidoreductase, partial [Planctomycetaceae bacterium]
PTADSLAGGLANTIAGRVCNYFDLHGGGYIVDGACSSSLLAVATAGRALSMGDMNVALVGGVDLSIDPFELVGFSRAGALSKGDMRVYDRNAAGFIAGEGCGFVVMKRLEDAKRDGDQIYAVMNGWGISSDGKGGIMTPSSSGQAMAIRRAYEGAGYSPADLDFVEGHGTGTKVGDQIELRGVAEAQTNGQPAPERRTGMTSLKSIIGHTKAAAGIGAFIKTTMAVNRRVLPPTGSCTDPNPVFNDACRSLYPLIYGQVADPNGKIRAGVSAMGFGGINSHVTLESGDAPNAKLAPSIDETRLLVANQTSEVFVFTAATNEHAAVEVSHTLNSADRLSASDLIDLSAEMSLRAANSLPIRGAIIAGSVDEFVHGLKSLKNILTAYPPAVGQVTSTHTKNVWLSNNCDKSRVGFLFPGQGAQQLLMSRKLVARYEWAREMLAAADRVQTAVGLPTMSEVVFADVQRGLDREQQTAMRQSLARTEVAQVAIVTTSMMYSKYLESMGITPAVCGGHSLGELTALHQAGAFDFETLLQLVSLRGRAMASPAGQAGAMAALFCSKARAESLIAEVSGYAVLANINSPNQVVVSGDVEAIADIMRTATEKEISSARLNVSNAFHSKYVQPASDLLRQQAPVPQHPQRLDIDVFSGMTGQAIAGNTDLRDYLSKQIVESVDFVSMVQAVEPHCDLLIEVGPHKVLSKLTGDILTYSSVQSQPTASKPNGDCDMNTVLALAFVHGVDVQWNKLFEARLARPFVPVDERKFIGNPCENDFVELGDVKQLHVGGSNPPAMTNEIESSKSGENGRVSMAMEAKLLTAESMGSATETSSGPMQPQPEPQSTPVETIRKEPMPMTPQPAVNDGIEEVIVDIIHERTGFPKETLTPEMRLLDDLNLDSIKAGDVIASAARKLGALGPIDPASLANATIGDVVVAVRGAKNGDAAPAMEAPASIAPMQPVASMSPAPMASSQMAPAAPIQPAMSSAPMVPAPMAPAPMAPAAPMQSASAMAQPAQSAMAPAMTEAPAPAMPAAEMTIITKVDDGIEDTIIEIIHDRTGFPKDTLTTDLRLLDDLNMDSIKAGDIVATAARKLGALGPIDPATLANATIGDVVVAVRQAKGGDAAMAAPGPAMSEPAKPMAAIAAPTAPMTPATPAGGMMPAQPAMAKVVDEDTSSPTTQQQSGLLASSNTEVNDWVRNFELELVTHRPKAKQQDISGNHYRVLHDQSRAAYCQLLQRRFHERGASVSFETYTGDGMISGDAHNPHQPYFVIAILPKQSEMMGTARERITRMIHRLRRAVANTNPASDQPLATGVAFVQFGNGRFGICGNNDIESCTAAGFARALHLESPALQVRIIDFADKLSDFLSTDFITNEVAAVGQFRDAAFDELGRRFETRHKLLQPNESKPMALNLGMGDVVLVTGGARGITAECALAMAEKTGANFALVGSSRHPSASSGMAAGEIAATLQRFSTLPGNCEYFSCNLTDENAVRQLVMEVEGKLGKITGVVHGAGRNNPGMASAATGEAVLSEISPKVLGATNLLEALGDRSLKCLVGLTSIIGVTGIPGNSWYAFSNETLDLLLRQY